MTDVGPRIAHAAASIAGSWNGAFLGGAMKREIGK